MCFLIFCNNIFNKNMESENLDSKKDDEGKQKDIDQQIQKKVTVLQEKYYYSIMIWILLLVAFLFIGILIGRKSVTKEIIREEIPILPNKQEKIKELNNKLNSGGRKELNLDDWIVSRNKIEENKVLFNSDDINFIGSYLYLIKNMIVINKKYLLTNDSKEIQEQMKNLIAIFKDMSLNLCDTEEKINLEEYIFSKKIKFYSEVWKKVKKDNINSLLYEIDIVKINKKILKFLESYINFFYSKSKFPSSTLNFFELKNIAEKQKNELVNSIETLLRKINMLDYN